MKFAFILSSGRTGTQFLARYLDANFAGARAVHEPPPVALLRVLVHGRLSGRLPEAPLLRLLARRRRQLESEAQPCALYIESNPYLSTAIGPLLQVFPEASVVHIVRDPRDYVKSALNHGVGTGLKGWANRWIPFWYPDVAGALGMDGPLDWLETAAAQWKHVNRVLEEHRTQAREYHRIAYEEIFAEGNAGLDALCRAVGLDPQHSKAAISAAERMNAGRLTELGEWRSWDRETRLRVDRICGDDMRRYGYGLEPDWLGA